MQPWISCHVEKFENDLWYIMLPDGSRADHQGYKSKGAATIALNYYLK